MAQIKDEQSVSRRSFLKAAAVTAAAATATGASAALLQGTNQATSPLPNALSLPVTRPTLANTAAASNELFAQLAAVQADNIRLQARLDAAERRLQAEETGSSEVEVLRAELETSGRQVSLLAGLLALYEQLEGVDLGEVLDEGLAAVGTSLSDLVDELPTLSESIESGRRALDEFDEHIPALEEGRQWLDEQTGKLRTTFATIEALLAAAVESSGPIMQMLNEWFQGILKWLPFGLGRRAVGVMEAIADLLTETPNTVTGIDNHVVQPLDVWLKRESGEVPLRQNLVKPLREEVLERSSQTMWRARQLQATYQSALAEPAQTASETQRTIRQLIVEYRRQHQI